MKIEISKLFEYSIDTKGYLSDDIIEFTISSDELFEKYWTEYNRKKDENDREIIYINNE